METNYKFTDILIEMLKQTEYKYNINVEQKTKYQKITGYMNESEKCEIVIENHEDEMGNYANCELVVYYDGIEAIIGCIKYDASTMDLISKFIKSQLFYWS